MTKQLVGFGAAVMTTLLALVVLWQFRSVVVIVLISLILVAALRPLVIRLAGRTFLVRVAWILLYLVALGGFGYLLFLTGETAIEEIQQLANTVSVRDEWRLSFWFKGSPLEQTLVAQLPPPSKLFEAVIGDPGQRVPSAIFSLTQSIGNILSGVFIILLLSIYWTIHQTHFERLWLSLLPSSQRIKARNIWQTVEPEIGAYIRGEVIQSLLAGLLLALGFWLLDSPYPALLALVGALACLIPMVGAVFTVISVLALGLLTSVQLSLVTAVYTLVVLLALGVWAKPRLFNRRWDHPILTLLLLIAMADAFGTIGIIIAPLLSIICQILWSRLVSRRTATEAAAQASDLKERQERIWDTIKGMDEPPPALVTNSMERLTQLIEKAEPVLQTGLPTVVLPAGSPESFHSSQPVTAEGGPPASTKPWRHRR